MLFVAEKRAAIDAVLSRLEKVGLGDLVLDLHDGPGAKGKLAQQFAKALADAATAQRTDMAVAKSNWCAVVMPWCGVPPPCISNGPRGTSASTTSRPP